ncbi:hypothetical protein AGR6A_Cc190095 [Agrobacterium sp. NCPPB 925]|nr:hypothetical protein AGR6A_Cc190095 [Agrobacterium sp. NCPPB 925]
MQEKKNDAERQQEHKSSIPAGQVFHPSSPLF